MRFQLTVAQQAGNAAVERRANGLIAGHHLHIFQLVGMLGKQFVLLERMNELLIGQFMAVAHAVDQHDIFVLLPGIELLQDGQKRRQPGAGGQQPQIPAALEAVGGQIAVVALLHQNRIADLQLR